MNNTVIAKIDNGLEVLLRVISVLKRKRFHIKSINMEKKKDSSYSNLEITFEDGLHTDIDRAITQIEKLIDVHEVKKLNAA